MVELGNSIQFNIAQLASTAEPFPLERRGNGNSAPSTQYSLAARSQPVLLIPAHRSTEVARSVMDRPATDVALRVEQTHAEVESLRKVLSELKKEISTLKDDTEDNRRFASFQLREQRSRMGLMEDLQRKFTALKGRLDILDSRADGDYHAYNSFEAVSRRLTELDSLERSVRIINRRMTITMAAFGASVIGWAIVLLSG